MKTSKAFAFFVLVILLCSCKGPADYSYIRVTRVIDGDTVTLADGQALRYIGIDTPETKIKKNGEFVYEPQPFSLEAMELNRSLVEGKAVRVEFDVVRKDSYGRLLGYCFVDDVFVNARLLEEGLAVVYTFPPNVKYADTFYALQVKARQEKQGFWGSYETIPDTQAANHLNQIRAVRGRVRSTYQSGKAVFLNFGKDYKTDFTVVIFNNVLPTFRQQHIEPGIYYKGKTVEVIGRIKEYNGPEIIANAPYQIEVIPEQQ